MAETPQVQRDADELTSELLRAIARSDVPTIAANAMMQATFAQQCAEAILQLLRHKGIITEGDIQTALANAYHARSHKLKNSGNVVVPPMLRPNGSF